MSGENTARWREPLRVWLIVLVTVFAAETCVMIALPSILPAEPTRTFEAAVDAMLLTLVLAPVLWWLLLRPLREANRARAEFLGELFTSIEADRRQTALELHDGVGQSLSLLVSGLRSAASEATDSETVRRYRDLKGLAKSALVDVKRLALGLRPSVLDDLGLAPALERLADDVRENHPITLALDLIAVADLRLPNAVESAAFRIAQEALANVVAHSKARHVDIVIRLSRLYLELVIADDGVGISPDVLAGGRTGHLGLTGMRERATLLDGEFSVHSVVGQGTRITVRLPRGGEPT